MTINMVILCLSMEFDTIRIQNAQSRRTTRAPARWVGHSDFGRISLKSVNEPATRFTASDDWCRVSVVRAHPHRRQR